MRDFDQNQPLNEKMVCSLIPILIVGETGTGKTTLARKIHHESGFSGKFVSLNLSSFSSSLVESEVFGHLKGSFTGAIQDKKGAIALSEGGTLFLDEIDSLSLSLQTKLLTFLDNGVFRPVGGDFERSIQTRLICASGKNLVHLVRSGKMRRDFFFRIQNGLTLKLPRLRESPRKLKLLLEDWQRKYACRLSKELEDFYLKYEWPGNYRQLRGHLELKRILSKGAYLKFDEVDNRLIELNMAEINSEGNQLNLRLDQIKKSYCQKVYQSQGFNIQKSIDILGVSRNTFKKILSSND